MGFCPSQKYSSTSRKIDVRTIGFEPAFTVGTSDSDPLLYDHGYLGEATYILMEVSTSLFSVYIQGGSLNCYTFKELKFVAELADIWYRLIL